MSREGKGRRYVLANSDTELRVTIPLRLPSLLAFKGTDC